MIVRVAIVLIAFGGAACARRPRTDAEATLVAAWQALTDFFRSPADRGIDHSAP